MAKEKKPFDELPESVQHFVCNALRDLQKRRESLRSDHFSLQYDVRLLQKICEEYELPDDERWKLDLAVEQSDVDGLISKLINFAPESGFPMKEGVYGEDPNEPLDPDNPKSMSLANGCPFFSEAYLYALLGKEDARTIRSFLRQLIEEVAPDILERF